MIPAISTDFIDLSVTSGVPVSIPHGMGRQVAGWLVIWRDAAIEFIAQSAMDSSRELVLVPVGSGNVRLVLL